MTVNSRVGAFCERFRLEIPIMLAPMAGVPAPDLSAAVINAGGMGALGGLLMQPAEILAWAAQVSAASSNRSQLNLWVPDQTPVRDQTSEEAVRQFLGEWGPEVPSDAGDAVPPDFAAQCDAIIEARPAAISSVMGLFPSDVVLRARAAGIPWFAVVSTVGEARQAEAAGADVIVVQGMEAGGHRAAFDPNRADRELVGLMSLVPLVCDAVEVPVVATGGIADARGVAAVLALGASAAQIGTGFLRTPEADIPAAWADAIGQTNPEDTRVSRVFSGRPGRSIATAYVEAAIARDAPPPAPYPVQRGLTAIMRGEAIKTGDIGRMQAWAGQSAVLASTELAKDLTGRLWAEARLLLS